MAKANGRSRRSLDEYQAKRDFARTPEPSGTAAASKRTPAKKKGSARRRFCVQKHLASSLHYDFRLEHAGVLLSWAVPKGPSLRPEDKRLAMQTEDHPLDYGNFEGVIPEGYGAGIVVLWDEGTWEPDEGFDDVDAALAKGELKFRLDGRKLKGSWVLVRTRGRFAGGAEGAWLLIKHRDRSAKPIDITATSPRSVKSKRDFAEVLAGKVPAAWRDREPTSGAASKLLRQAIAEADRLSGARKSKPSTRRTTRATATKPPTESRPHGRAKV